MEFLQAGCELPPHLYAQRPGLERDKSVIPFRGRPLHISLC